MVPSRVMALPPNNKWSDGGPDHPVSTNTLLRRPRVCLPPLSDLAAKLDELPEYRRPSSPRISPLPKRMTCPAPEMPYIDLSAYAHSGVHRRYNNCQSQYRPGASMWHRSEAVGAYPRYPQVYRTYERPRAPAYEERYHMNYPRYDAQLENQSSVTKRKELEEQLHAPLAKIQRHTSRGGVKEAQYSKGGEQHVCQGCSATSTPEWRKGPTGPRTLCNACGLLYAKMLRKRENDAIVSAAPYNANPMEIRKQIAESLRNPKRCEEALEALREDVRIVASVKQSRMNLSSNTRPSHTKHTKQ